MEQPKFKLDFTFGEFFKIDKQIETPISDSSILILDRRDNPTLENPNRGSLIFQADTLDYYRANEIGMNQIDNFLNLLIVASKTEIPPATFADEPILLNREKFEGQTITPYISIPVAGDILAQFEDEWAKKTIDLAKKANKLTGEQQQAITKSFSWLRKITNAKSASENFVYRWISLEALVGILDGKIQPSTMVNINRLMEKMTNETAQGIFENHKEVISRLAEETPLRGGNKKPNNEARALLRQAVDAIYGNLDYKEVVKKTASCVYEVRNQLFHRGVETSLVDKCNPLLRDLMLKTLEDFLLDL